LEPPNKRMQLTKPAQAMELRSLCPVLCRRDRERHICLSMTRTPLTVLLLLGQFTLQSCASARVPDLVQPAEGAAPGASEATAEEVTPPRPIQSPDPPIPTEQKGQPCTSGVAVVEAVVGRDGRVQRARVLRESPSPAYDHACLSNAYRWTFQPGMRHGRPVDARAIITCRLECR
jgi:TonB family protein